MGKGQWYKGAMEGRVVLDEKHFRRCDKFEGNPANFKSWMFDLITAVGSVDQSLARDLRVQLKERPKVEVIDGKFDIHFEIDLQNHAKYKGELYSLIVGLASGEAKCVVRGINEKGWASDGFLALVMVRCQHSCQLAAVCFGSCQSASIEKPPRDTQGNY